MIKHFVKDDSEPKLDQSKLILYMYQFCPFSRRVALTLTHHEIKHERIYIDLKNKPEWFININPTGKVPMIEQEGQKLLDSEMICRYLDQLIEGDNLVFNENVIKSVNDWWSKIFKSFHAIAFETSFSKEQESIYLDSLMDFEMMLHSNFISGDQIGLADYLVYPVMELTNICMSRIKHQPISNNSLYPRTNAWFHNMDNIPAIQKERISEEVHKEYINTLGIPLDD